MKMKRLPAVVLAVLFGLFSLSVSAEVLINENFDYEAGQLYKSTDIPAPIDGNWHSYKGGAAINVVDGNLIYADYAPEAVGRSVAMPKSGEGVLRAFNGVTSGTVYYSALVKVNAARKPPFGSIAPFLSFGDNTTSGVGAGVSVFSSGDGFKFGLSKIKEEATLFSEELTLGGTYLVVVKYEIVDGDDNDVISLFVNPVKGGEPAPVAKIDAQYEVNNKADLSPVSSINLTQGTSSPDCIVDAVKVFTEWNDLFVKDTGDSPAIIPAEENISFGPVRNAKEYTHELTVRAKNLTGDIALSITEGDVTLSAASISKADAESEAGGKVTLTLSPTVAGEQTATLLLTSDGADDVECRVTWTADIVPEHTDMAAMRTALPVSGEEYGAPCVFTGKAVVTMIYEVSTTKYMAVQDAAGGIILRDPMMEGALFEGIEVGDVLTGIYGAYSPAFGSNYFDLYYYMTVTGETMEAVPVEADLAAIQADGAAYEGRLVKLSGVTLTPQDGNTAFEYGKNPTIGQGDATATLRLFAGRDYIGQTIPAKADIVAVSTSGNGSTFAPRAMGDIVAVAEDPEPPVEESDNLFLNGGFEEWTSGLGTVSCADWTLPLGGAEQETADVIEGNYALKITSGPMNTNSLSQEIGGYPNPFVAGQTYELTINYKVLTSMEGKDLKLECVWSSTRDGDLDHDAGLLQTDWFTSAGWESKTITTTVPEGATTFKFILTMPKGAVVLFDDFSFAEKVSSEPALSVTPPTLPGVTCRIGEEAKFSEVNIVYANLGRGLTFDITGADRAMFAWDTVRVTPRQLLLNIAYRPTEIGTHKGMMIIESPDHSELNVTIPLSGSAFDASARPVITLTPSVIPPFTVEEGSDSTFRFTLTSENCMDDISIRMEHVKGEGFVVSDSYVVKNTVVDMSVTFRPVVAGEYESRMTFSTPEGDDVVITLTGTATEKTGEPVKDYLTSFVFDMSSPRKLLLERFDGVANNQTLSVDGWSNIVLRGDLPWRGFAETDAETGDTLNRCAKANVYQYQIEGGDLWEMWLMTPALDFANAESKMFTFRVMGDLMFEGHESALELYYIDTIPGEDSYFGKVDMEMPSSPDLNGEWSEIHMDLEGQNIADVFFMAFRFTGINGKGNSVSYYVDDVSFGRTDLAVIKPSLTELVMTSVPGRETVSEPVKVTGDNLVEPILLKVGGSNPSNFTLSTSVIPVEGGEFTVKFKSDNEGVHEAYVKLSSRDAADKYIPMSVLNKVQSSLDGLTLGSSFAWHRDGVLYIDAASVADYALYDLGGRCLLSGTAPAGLSERGLTLPSGVYLLKIRTADGAEDIHKILAE